MVTHFVISVLILGVVSLFAASFAMAQCSDAGVCTLGGNVEHDEGLSGRHRIGLSYIFGRSNSADDITYQSVRVEASFNVADEARLSLLLPFNTQDGPAGRISGIGDVIVLWDQSVGQWGDGRTSIQIGGRFPTASVDEASLPQWYQSGLGTTDLLLGISATFGKFEGTVAGQIALGRSANSITRLKRGHDILMRGTYAVGLGNVLFQPGILLIKRFGESSILHVTLPHTAYPRTAEFIDVPESDQLQINIAGDLSYRLSDSFTLETGIALPILKRKVNVDGLTRSLTLRAGVQFSY